MCLSSNFLNTFDILYRILCKFDRLWQTSRPITQMRARLLIIATSLLLGHSVSAQAGTPYRRSLELDGRSRRYILYEPTRAGGTSPRPVMIALHGHQGSVRQLVRVSRLNDAAEQHGFLVAYPEGASWGGLLGGSWNTFNCCGYALAKHIDDVAFVRAVIEDVQQAYGSDPHRVYATGVSNGAMLAYRVACELSERIAAIAPVAGAMRPELCQPSRAVSVAIFHGTHDRYVSYHGGHAELGATRSDTSVEAAVSFWVQHNGCAAAPTIQREGAIEHVRYGTCREGSEVALYTVHGGGHAWPGGRRGWVMGSQPTKELSATEAMWEFFAQHPKSDNE